ncbi:YceD family protein [Hahella sp. HN01]|uniref:YceD family protein n=1 Tax=Hahella sp. HN01 TaxID=2847262 RepID=UPI001C1EC9A8|nr:YceD family protein [Hahella sp. HN01]MBU6954342.1 DUF177 domain-containing protein [Hahella sp. HN01]
MKKPGIPELVDPYKMCEKELTLEGVILAKALPRYADQLAGGATDSDQVEASARFRRDEQGSRVAYIVYSTLARLTCQRCLGEVGLKINGETTFAFLGSESELDQLPRSYEPVLMEGSEVNLLQAIEDELLLSLPMFAYHEDEHCSGELNEIKGQASETKADNPFSVLGDLLKK